MSFTLVDRILYNGHIRTLNDAQPVVSALAISNGRVVAAGGDDEIRALAGVSTVQENLNGRFVVPGMTDAHVHWQLLTNALHEVQLFNLPSKQAALDLVAARAQQLPAASWIMGFGWAQDDWEGGQFPTAQDLDSVAPNHPVFLQSRSGHAGWANSLGLRLGGVDASTPDPAGGEIQRDPDGNPTGILFEWSAIALVKTQAPPKTVDTLATEMKVAQNLALSLGVTGIHDFDDQECFSALQIMRERGDLAIRVVKNFNQKYLNAMLETGLRRGFGDDWIRIGAFKLFADGALGPHSAAMFDPYEGEPGNLGIVIVEKEDMIEMVSRASAAGFPSTVHAIGDRAVHDVLDVFELVRGQEAARGEARNTRRHRIEHVQLIHPNDVDRLAQLDLVASMQPIHATSDYPVADKFWGARSAYSYNPRLQLDSGVTVAFGSDTPVEPLGSMRSIHAAVTRQRADGSPGPDGWYPSARLTVDEALRGHTIGAAYAVGMDDHLGRLAPGYLADLVLLNRDMYTVEPSELLNVEVVSTMVGGTWRWGEYAR